MAAGLTLLTSQKKSDKNPAPTRQTPVELGSTVHTELLAHRLEVAQNLLRNTDLRAGEVAQQAGFTTLQYMYAVFKRELGFTPAEYRDHPNFVHSAALNPEYLIPQK